MLNKKKRNNKGFTLVELLVVIAIIGILAVVAVPSLFANINKAKAADIIADYSTIKTAVVSQHADQSLVTGEYTKPAGTAGKLSVTISNKTSVIDVDDLSKDVGYKLNVNTTTEKATLSITAQNEDVATKIKEQLGITTPDAGAVNTGLNVTIEILK